MPLTLTSFPQVPPARTALTSADIARYITGPAAASLAAVKASIDEFETALILNEYPDASPTEVKALIGLESVDNTSDVNKPVSTATQTALNLKANIASPTFTGTVSGITKSMVGLGNVDNTSDANKPISTATQTALNLKADTTTVQTALDLKQDVLSAGDFADLEAVADTLLAFIELTTPTLVYDDRGAAIRDSDLDPILDSPTASELVTALLDENGVIILDHQSQFLTGVA